MERIKPIMLKLIRELISAGEKARVYPSLPVKVAIFDRKITICALEDPITHELSANSMIVKHAGLAESLAMTFEHIWQMAEGVESIL